MGSRVSSDQRLERPLGRFGEHARQADRERDAERVAERGGVLDRRQTRLAGHAEADRSSLGEDLFDPRRGIVLCAHGDLGLGEVADAHQEVVHVVGVPRAAPLGEPLQLHLQLVERRRIEQVAELLFAQQLAQQVPVEGERGGAPLRERRVALIHVDGHPPEQQRLRERRRPFRVDSHELRPTRTQVRHDLAESRHVEHVAQAFARRLQEHRKRRMLRRGDQQVGGALPLLPERRPLSRPPPGEQQRARRGLAERAREQRGAGQGADDLFLDLVGIEQQVVERDAILGLWQADHDAVVAPQDLRARADAFREARLDRQAPGGVHALAERRQDAEAPVAELVAEPFDDDRAVVGDGAGGLALVVNVLDQSSPPRARRARRRRASASASRPGLRWRARV